MKRILLALCLLVMTTQAWSQVPQLRSYPRVRLRARYPRRSHRSEKSTLSSLFAEPPGNP